MKDLPQSFSDIARLYEDELPPVQSWNPPLNGDLDMRIDREGRWFYQGDQIRRDSLVKLFSSIVKHEDGEYFLVTPVEKWRITVDVAPFVVTSVRQADELLLFTTNVGNEFPLDNTHPLTVTEDALGHPLPLVKAHRRLDALLNRPVFYQLVDWSSVRETDNGEVMVITSGQDEFILGQC